MDYSDFGISNHFWTDFEYNALNDDGDVITFKMRVKYIRNSKHFVRDVQDKLQSEFDATRDKFLDEFNAAKDAMASEELSDTEREKKEDELDQEFKKRLDAIRDEFDQAVLESVVLDWDWSTVNGQPINFSNLDERDRVFELFPQLSTQLIAHWRDVTSEEVIRKN